MSLEPENQTRRFHLALSVADVDATLADFSRRLGCEPCVVVAGEYALWRTATLNVSIRRGDAMTLRHLVWEDDAAPRFEREADITGLVWEHPSARQQMEEIRGLWPRGKTEIH
jgi:hypothetical protein